MSTQITISPEIKLVVNTTPITGGSAGQILFQTTGNTVGESSNLFWDNPNGIFNVVGRINAKSTTAQPSSLIVEGTTGVNSGNAGFVVRTGTGYQATFFAADNLSGQGISGLGIFTGSATPFGLQTGAPNGAFFIHNNGNIGIGTSYTNAGFKLDVNGTARVSGQINLGTNVSASTSSGFGLNYINFNALTANQGISAAFVPNGTPTGYAYSFQFTKSSTANTNSLLIIGGGASAGPAGNRHLITTSTDGTATAQPLSFAVATGSWASATPLMTLTTTQNVLINTTTDAGFRLDVNGTARVQGVLSTTTDASFNGVVIGRGGGNNNSNTGVGLEILQSNSTGIGNTGIGQSALRNNTTASHNTAVGTNALRSNSTSGENTAIGNQSMQNNTGNRNTAVGVNTLNTNTGTENSALGRVALQANTSGNFNTGIGSTSLNGNTTGSGNSALGYNTQSGNFSNSVILGHSAAATASNQFVVGSSSVNAGSVTTETNISTQVWNVVINGVARKILLA